MLCKGIDVKRLWKNLRDQFRREYLKAVYEGHPVKWRYYGAMSFLMPQLEFEFGVLNKKSQIQNDESENDIEIIENPVKNEMLDNEHCYLEDVAHQDANQYSPLLVNVDDIEEPSSSQRSCSDDNSNRKTKKETNNDENEQHLHKRIKLHQDGDKESADLQFFKSLLPYMESFELFDRLEIRNKIQTLILEKYKELKNNY